MYKRIIAVAICSAVVVPREYKLSCYPKQAQRLTRAKNIEFYNKQQQRKKKGGKVNFK